MVHFSVSLKDHSDYALPPYSSLPYRHGRCLPNHSKRCFHMSNRSPTHRRIRRHSVPQIYPVRAALVNVRAWTGYQILEHDTIMIENGTVVSYLSSAEVVVEGLGCVLLSGFINSHCHPENVSDFEDLASYGMSTDLAIASVTRLVQHNISHQA
jgi:hypothetical protein